MRNIWDSRARKKGVVFLVFGFLLIGFAPTFAADSPKPSKSTPPKRRAEDVDDKLRAQLSLRFGGLIRETEYGYFSFANHSSVTISLPGQDMEQSPGRKLYLTSHARYFCLQKDSWKQVDVASDGGCRFFDVPPKTQVTLLISIRQAFGYLFDQDFKDKRAKVCLGKICSEPFDYANYVPSDADLKDALAKIKKRVQIHVDDKLRRQLDFRYEFSIPHADLGVFTFANHSTKIITLVGPLFDDDFRNKKVYYITHPDHFWKQGDDWKEEIVLHDSAAYEFDVNPRAEIYLLVPLYTMTERRFDGKTWKIGLDKILSDPFCLKPKPHPSDDKATSK